MPAKDRNYYFTLAETILNNPPFSKEAEARFRSACYLAQIAGGDEIGRASCRERV